MSWEKFETDFPYGVETNIGFQTASTLRQDPEIQVITINMYTPAREMTIKEEVLIYSQQNDLAIALEYNINDEISHPDIIYPLNIYGTAMLRDFLNYNYIPNI